MRQIIVARRTRIYWLCQLIGWMSWNAMGILYSLSGGPRGPILRIVPVLALSVVVEIAWTHGYRAVIRRRGWLALPPTRLALRLVVSSLVIGVAVPYTTWPGYYLTFPDVRLFGSWTLSAIGGQSWATMAWSVVYVGVHYFERWRQAELDKLQLAIVAAEGQLHSLMSQLNPHFLFNCLNSVRALIVEDPAKAQTAVTALSSLMRYSMQAGKVATVDLATELEMVETYLSLEAIRLDERLTRRVEVTGELGALHVPTMLIQLLVENGVKHGIERLPAGGAIGVTCARDGEALRVTVTNTGRIEAPRPGATRVGLSNARERLRLLYGGRARLELRQTGDVVIAELSLPVHRNAAREAA